MSKSILLICLFLLFCIASAAAVAAQLGRITGEVNFREGPSRSTRIIGRLVAGADVQIVKRDPAGWYLVNYRGRRGFVHQNYIKISQSKKSPDYSLRIGIILVAVGFMLITHAFVPLLSKTVALLLGSFILVMVTDLLFRLGVLYSVFAVLFGLLIPICALSWKKKRRMAIANGEPDHLRKAA